MKYKDRNGMIIELSEDEYNDYPKNVHLTLIEGESLVKKGSRKTKKTSEE